MGSPDCATTGPSEQLTEALLAYLEAAEAGVPQDRRQFLERYPEFATELGDYLACRDGVESIVGPFRVSGTGNCPATAAGDFDIRREPGISPRPVDTPAALSHHRSDTGFGAEPCLLGDFWLYREVGRGGMGIVYEAEQISLGRRVALKVLPSAAGRDARQLQRFKNEAQAVALLQHPNIVPVHAVGSEQGTHYYAMQFIDGWSLAAWIEDLRQKPDARLTLPGPLVPRAAGTSFPSHPRRRAGGSPFVRRMAQLVLQAARALEYAHHQGVVHRDIKPANLLLDEHGEVWITDFGLALFHSGGKVTRTGELVGTLRYMSPEQAEARRGLVDHRTDIYSLGVTAYELLTLQPAFPGREGHELLYQIAHKDPSPPRSINRDIPVDLETILLKATAKNPADRYATAGDLADDLQQFLDDRPIRARRAGPLDTLSRWARRHRPVVAAALGGLLLAAVGLAVSTVLIAREQAETKAAYERERQRAQEAIDQRARAEAAFRQARKAVDLLAELSDEDLSDRQSSLDMRMRLLEVAIAYNQEFIEQHGGDQLVQAELESSKHRVESLLRDLAALQDGNPLELLTCPPIQEDLGLSPVQKARVAECWAGVERFPGPKLDEVVNRTSVHFRKRILEDNRRGEEAAAGILTAAQARRFRQISLQLRDVSAFHDPEVTAVLNLTSDKRCELLRRYQSERRACVQDVFRNLHADTPLATLVGWLAEMPARAMARTLEVLTVDQRARWAELTGPSCPRPLYTSIGKSNLGTRMPSWLKEAR
ncbi:MAG: prkC 35 [Gemmataceae bacterium]|nr:prkC 35 [Gemmataceae bacterium]